MTTVHIEYYAILREQAGRDRQTLITEARDLAGLFEQLQLDHGFSLPRSRLRVAMDDAFCDWQAPLHEGARVVFVPPVAGG